MTKAAAALALLASAAATARQATAAKSGSPLQLSKCSGGGDQLFALKNRKLSSDG